MPGEQSGTIMKIESKRTWTYTSAIILLLSAGWIWLSASPAGATTQGAIPVPRQGFQAPDFELPNTQGENIRLSSLRGQPVIINLWASWCTPCRAEMPAIQKVYEEYAGLGLVVLGVNASNQDNIQTASQFVEDNGLTFPILWDIDGQVSQLYLLSALPTTFFISGDGVIQEVVVGGPMAEALLKIRVEQLFEKTGSESR
jgi:cytochrome c biogenesis protein CcmG, thiol:disulfide interchange protein DsbE